MLPYSRTYGTFHRMKTTLVLPDPLVDRLKAEATARSVSMSAVVTEALLRMFDSAPTARAPYRLPTLDGGPTLMDIANREVLYDLLDGDPGV